MKPLLVIALMLVAVGPGVAAVAGDTVLYFDAQATAAYVAVAGDSVLVAPGEGAYPARFTGSATARVVEAGYTSEAQPYIRVRVELGELVVDPAAPPGAGAPTLAWVQAGGASAPVCPGQPTTLGSSVVIDQDGTLHLYAGADAYLIWSRSAPCTGHVTGYVYGAVALGVAVLGLGILAAKTGILGGARPAG